MLFNTHKEERILEEISKLKPSKHNKFFHWRRYESGETPISKKSSIPDKIKAGYYNFPNSYFWGAQLSLLEMNREYSKHRDYGKFIENSGVQKNRYKRLMEDFHKDETLKLERIVEDFTNGYILKKDQVKEILENFDGTIDELYNHFEKKYSYTYQKTWKRSF